MAKRRYTFEELQKMDEEILALSAYEAAGGMLISPSSPEEIIRFNTKLAAKFNYFKSMLRAGEVTLLELKDLVYTKNGAVPQSDEEDIDKLISGIEQENAEMEMGEKLGNSLMKSISSMFKNKIQPKGELHLDLNENLGSFFGLASDMPPKTPKTDNKKEKRKYKKKNGNDPDSGTLV